MLGRILSDRYIIQERIGEGGMANVFKAKDNRLDREVAIKILKQEFVEDNDFIENFRRESYSAAKLNHQNIVGVFDVGVDVSLGQKTYYIVMEIVNGKTLKEVIKEKERLSVSDTLYYTIQISEALLCAHDNGIIHRDIKPQNIIINKDNLPKVTDFGIAQGANKHTATENDIMGSVHYFSPEQARGDRTDQRSDIYSLGIVLYEMLTGQIPFDGENPISIALKQVNENIKIPSQINPEIPSQLDRIIIKMTNKNPEDRYNNMQEVIDDLKSFEKKLDLEMSDTLIIPINKSRKENKVSVDDQRRIRRSGIESEKNQSPNHRKTSSQNRKRSIAPILGGIFTALVVSTLIFILLTRFPLFGSRNVAEIYVPDIMGLNQEEAKEIIENMGLRFEVIGESINYDYDVGQIIHQDPEYGTKVKENFLVRVTINSEDAEKEELIEVKDYTDLNLEEAISLIELDELDYEIKFDDVENEKDFNMVMRQEPKARSMVDQGSKIIIYVGREIDVETVPMPEVKGQSEKFAKEAIESLGLVLGKVSERETDLFSPDTIIEASYKTGEDLEVGTIVNLVKAIPKIEEEPKVEEETPSVEEKPTIVPPTTIPDSSTQENSMTVNISFEIPESKGQGIITIKRMDGNTVEEVYKKTHYSSEGRITKSFTGSDTSIYQIFIDDVLHDTRP